MSGGDKIMLELLGHWKTAGVRVCLLTCPEGLEVVGSHSSSMTCCALSTATIRGNGLIVGYLRRIFEAVARLPNLSGTSIIYSSSDFLTDVIPASIAKLRTRNSRLVCALFLFAPSPFQKHTSRRFADFLYYFAQLVSIAMMKRFADLVFVLNSPDGTRLESMGFVANKIAVISGGVCYEEISRMEPRTTLYEACFVGRFHEQKGIYDLIRIWGYVCKSKPAAKLAIVGWGSEKAARSIRDSISRSGIQSNIYVLGFLDGIAKFEVMKSSKLLLFPSHRESWGLVVCEAMACGTPVVAYDLAVYREPFAGAIRTVAHGDVESFSKAVVELLRKDDDEYERLREKGLAIASNFDWHVVSGRVLRRLKLLAQ
jgi:glycosyltransferase involved in cell wall biosynthesis